MKGNRACYYPSCLTDWTGVEILPTMLHAMCQITEVTEDDLRIIILQREKLYSLIFSFLFFEKGEEP